MEEEKQADNHLSRAAEQRTLSEPNLRYVQLISLEISCLGVSVSSTRG